MNADVGQRRPFADRNQAGEELASVLVTLDLKNPVVLGLARGGVVVAAPVARSLGVPLNALVVRKIGAPQAPEFAVGAIAEGVGTSDEIILIERAAADSVGVPTKVIDLRVHEEQDRLRKRIDLYRPGNKLPDMTGREVVLIDDGIATGHTARAACNAVKRSAPSRLVVAVPVCPRSAVRQFADVELVAIRRPENFRAVGQFYSNFEQVGDDEVIRLLHNRLKV